jgi:hypothetical protein
MPPYVIEDAWSTDAFALGTVRNGTLEGDLLIRGQGAPKLTLEDFWMFLRGIQARGIREIRGDLVLDRSHYGFEAGDPGRFDNEPTQVYNTLPDALLVNFKAVRVTFIPDLENRRVHIVTEPNLTEVAIVNNIVLDNAACPDWRARMRPEIRADQTSAQLVFSGQMSAQCGEQTRHASTRFFTASSEEKDATGHARPPPARLHRRWAGPTRARSRRPLVGRVDAHLGAEARDRAGEVQVVDRRVLGDQRVARRVDARGERPDHFLPVAHVRRRRR